jgi:hypothetical protein
MVSVQNTQIISKTHTIIQDQDLDPVETRIKITKGKTVMAVIAIRKTITQILLLNCKIVPQSSSLMQ